MEIELDLEKIKKIAGQREDENWRFRSFLKGRDSEKLDRVVHHVNLEISENIDCTKCGNCCKHMYPSLNKKEISVLSKNINISVKEFNEKYTVVEDGEIYIKNKPCTFLSDNKCTVYGDRPNDCREFPFLNKKDFVTRLMGVISNYEICPIVFNVYERLKREYNFR